MSPSLAPKSKVFLSLVSNPDTQLYFDPLEPLAGGRSLGVRRVDVIPSELHQGLDFGRYFDREDIVFGALVKLIANLQNEVLGYCLRFNDRGPSNDSTFEPYPGIGVLPDRTHDFNEAIHFERLLISRWEWPPLAYSHRGDLHPPPPFFPDAAWRGQVLLRAQSDGVRKHVGYFKVVLPNGDPIEPSTFVDACRQAKKWLDDRVLDILDLERDGRYTRDFMTTKQFVKREISQRDFRSAVAHFAHLFTSHFVCGLNRFCLFAPNSQNPRILSCVYAHGGRGDDRWAQVQDHVVRQVSSISELHRIIEKSLPPDDPLFRELVGKQLDVDRCPSLISQLYLNGGSIDALPRESWIDKVPRIDADGSRYAARRLAARLQRGDPFLSDLQPDSALLACQNQNWYALPWIVGGKVWIVLCDLANWGRVDWTHDLVPRLREAEALLSYFAADFQDAHWS